MYVRGAKDSKRRTGDRHGNRPPVSGGGPKEAPRESTVGKRIRRVNVLEFLELPRSDDQPLAESQARHVMDLPGVRPLIKKQRPNPLKTAGPTPQRRLNI
jgi:hypothetical protein